MPGGGGRVEALHPQLVVAALLCHVLVLLLLLMVLVVARVRAVEAIGGVAVDSAAALVESLGVGHRSRGSRPGGGGDRCAALGGLSHVRGGLLVRYRRYAHAGGATVIIVGGIPTTTSSFLHSSRAAAPS